MKRLALIQTIVLAIALMMVSCIDDTSGLDRPDYADLPVLGIAAIGTDYFSTSVSIIDPDDFAIVGEGVLHSGSAVPGLSTALSGDVVFPSSSNPGHTLVIIDRYPNSTITFFDPAANKVEKQISVATGFASNPQDMLWLSEHKAYVTRYETNPDSGAEAFDEGDDVLVIDPTDGMILGNIPLSGYADKDSDPKMQVRPTRMAYDGAVVWVATDQLSANFGTAGRAKLIAIDPQSDSVERELPINNMRNCANVLYAPERDRLYTTCTGLFADGGERQVGASALLEINPQTGETYVLRSAADGSGQPFGFELAYAEPYLFAMRFGNLEKDIPDAAIAFNLDTGRETDVHMAGSPFGLGGLLVDKTRNRLLVCDADENNPRVLVYEIGETLANIRQFATHPESGLQPRHLHAY